MTLNFSPYLRREKTLEILSHQKKDRYLLCEEWGLFSKWMVVYFKNGWVLILFALRFFRWGKDVVYFLCLSYLMTCFFKLGTLTFFHVVGVRFYGIIFVSIYVFERLNSDADK